ncbi:amino acid ABC transporter permease [Marinactinospora thermotolerans]|uniref:Amino acid ABC transporter membrane protein 1, PAAT family n=1 Tax=Marinactinospora thermotolerans DSM 45154 TaxID=1122192 RepID=A0A1T4LK56_9ACTN|nr:amino acid ABC transporter permease [Marinactinospora thermotolerans]SJZ55130.1 amino acid ABC transporter membrane protein 1, PAAT family [Marinactinospora thermotolerans DSM 45154]
MEAFFSNIDKVVDGFSWTVRLTLLSALFSFILGVILTAMRVSPVPLLRGISTAYVEGIRNTPLTLVLLFCGLGLNSALGLHLSDQVMWDVFWWAVIGLSAYTSCFVSESLRAGINTIPVGQVEAARSLGLTFTQNLRLIVIPQALRTVVGPLGSVLIALTKNTTVASVAGLGVQEASRQMKLMFDQGIAPVLPTFFGFAVGFLILTLPMGYLFGWLSKRVAVVR